MRIHKEKKLKKFALFFFDYRDISFSYLTYKVKKYYIVFLDRNFPIMVH